MYIADGSVVAAQISIHEFIRQKLWQGEFTILLAYVIAWFR
jgi:hypothetical protein